MDRYWRIVIFSLLVVTVSVSCKKRETVVEPNPLLEAEINRLEAVERSLPAPEDYTDTIFGFPLEMVFVEGGMFLMGDDPVRQGRIAYGDEKPGHIVKLTSYYISRYEVTQELWEAVMGYNPSAFQQDKKQPVESVGWGDVCDFCFKITLITGNQYCLPTEAEWEYAAGGGVKGKRYKYSGSNMIGLTAWYGKQQPSPVGRMKPNELGIYDMSGNVWEWCADWYGKYKSDTLGDPQGPSSGFFKVLRGGCWGSDSSSCRICLRSGSTIEEYSDGVGFRVVRKIHY